MILTVISSGSVHCSGSASAIFLFDWYGGSGAKEGFLYASFLKKEDLIATSIIASPVDITLYYTYIYLPSFLLLPRHSTW
jgi:hypothetical protein